MNISNVSICTKYSVKGNRIISKNFEFLIVTRKKPTKQKAKKYLLHVESSKKRNYISSLYPVGNSINQFKLDYQGSTYFLSIEGNSAIIKSTL